MRKVLALAVRELLAWRALGWVALALALLVLTAPLWPRLGFQPPADVRGAVGLVLAAILVVGTALVVGMNFLGRELVEGRFGFYLALPARAWEIWLGKLVGATVAVYGAGMVVLAPTLLLDGLPPLRAAMIGELALGRGQVAAAIVLFLPLFVLLLSHWLGVALRARSLWLALELAAVVVAALALWSVTAWLVSQLAPVAGAVALGSAASLIFLGLLLAPWAQIAHGRTLIPRGHRAQALVAAGGLVLAAAAALGWQGWLRSGTPRDLVALAGLRAAPDGEWLTIGGRLSRRADVSPAFLLHGSTGAHHRAGVATGHWGLSSLLLFSPDGQEAIVRRIAGQWWRSPTELLWLRLGDGGIEQKETGLEIDPRRSTQAALGGGRLALWSEDRLSVHSLADGATLAAFRVPFPTWRSHLGFDGDILRLLLFDGAEPRLQALTFDLAEGRRREGHDQLLPSGSWQIAAVDAEAGLALVTGLATGAAEEAPARLHALATGELVSELPLGGRPVAARFLPGGRVLLAAALSPGLRLHLFTPDGEELPAPPDLDRRRLAGLGLDPEELSRFDSGELPMTLGWAWKRDAVTLVVGSWRPASRGGGREVHLLAADLEQSRWRHVGRDLVPAGIDRLGQFVPLPGSPGSRTFWRPARGELVRLDPDSGELETLLTTAGRLRASARNH